MLEDEEAALRGADFRDDLIPSLTEMSPGPFRFTAAPGFASDGVLFRTRGVNDEPARGVFWRRGNVLAVLIASPTTSDDWALRLARRQDTRIRDPHPVAETYQDDPELPLADPGLKLPVYWLGREFAPGDGLPALQLHEARFDDGPGVDLGIDYDTSGHQSPAGALGGDVRIDVWRRATWARFKQTKFAQLVWGWPCTDAARIPLEHGYAFVYAGYSTRVNEPCPSRPRDRFMAHAYLDDMVVVVNMPYCWSCAPEIEAKDPYNNQRGMEAIVRGLRLRPRGPAPDR